ncbi:transcription termination/antitermination protein NusG [Raineyella sp. LH-20]|uniref:transcription termination/antitermination protein NusG n=1 Tax=Raineyella sp. LH-20 TaxID=3081204 RepID=UPI0029540438|nr:transcription termination/antitermination protein NusG [Raineyella sp. LH-20]WOP19006.1 transcription termination/antitermination protein NusG [Raineyella sp. LH-20]
MADNDEFDPSEVEIDLDAFEDDTVGDEPDLDFGLDAEEPTDEELSAADIFGSVQTPPAEATTEPTETTPADEDEHADVEEAEDEAESTGTAPGAPARGLDDDFEINLNFDADQEEEQTSAAPVMDFDAEAAVATAMAELRTDLDSKFGDWYVVHTYAGMENRVKQNIEQRVTSLNMEDYIYETVVPTETVVEMKNGNKKEVTRVYLPGYVLVRMDLTDESWGCIRHTPAVTGFVGNANDPTPLTLDEVENMMRPSVVARVAASAVGKGKRPAKKVEVQDYQIGDSIMVIEGPFAGVPGIITEINPNTQRLIATVEFMGRDTPVDLTFPQIQKS